MVAISDIEVNAGSQSGLFINQKIARPIDIISRLNVIILNGWYIVENIIL